MLMVPAVRSLVLIVSYYLSWQFSARFEIAPDVSAVYPASGVLAFFLFLYGWRYLPAGILAILVGSYPQLPFWEWSTHNFLHLLRQIVVYGGGALLARHFGWLALPAHDLRNALRLIAFAVITALSSALLSVMIFQHYFPWLQGQLRGIFFTFWVGDFSGMLMILGVASLVGEAYRRFRAQRSVISLPVNYAAVLSLVSSSAAVFAFIAFLGVEGEIQSYGYLILLPVIFGTAAFGLNYGILSAFLVNVSAILAYTLLDFSLYPAIQLQLLCATVMCLGLILGASVDDRRKAHFDAQHDELTGLLNRRALFDQGALMLERSRRYHRPLALVMLDVDHFKRVNDSYGHAVGDRLLREVADRCRQASRKTDICARIGGEEFVLLLDQAGAEEALQAAERLRMEINKLRLDPIAGPISASFGVSIAGVNDESIGEMLLRADEGLYAAKDGGRNRTVFGSEQAACATAGDS